MSVFQNRLKNNRRQDPCDFVWERRVNGHDVESEQNKPSRPYHLDRFLTASKFWSRSERKCWACIASTTFFAFMR